MDRKRPSDVAAKANNLFAVLEERPYQMAEDAGAPQAFHDTPKSVLTDAA